MAHARTQTIARPVAEFTGSLRVAAAKLVDEHSAHEQNHQTPERRVNENAAAASSSNEKKQKKAQNEAAEAARIAQLPNPDWWPTTRAVPHYRPINSQLDYENRPFGRAGPERVFVTLMLGGVWLQALVRTAWQFSGSPGRSYFVYDVGGMY